MENWQPLRRKAQLIVGNKIRHPEHVDTPSKIAEIGKMKTSVGHRSCVILETQFGYSNEYIVSHFMETARSERLEILC